MNHPLTDEKVEELRKIIDTTDDPEEFDWAVWMLRTFKLRRTFNETN